MQKLFTAGFFISLFFLIFSCNSYDVEGRPDVTSEPPKWIVDYTYEKAGEDTTREFTIRNLGITGELTIQKINLIKETESGYVLLKEAPIFTFQLPNISKGITRDGFTKLQKTTFTNNSYNSLCPLDPNDTEKCKENFSTAKYNKNIKIKVNYNLNVANTNNKTGNYYLELCTNDPGKNISATCGKNSTSHKVLLRRLAKRPPLPKAVLDCRNPSKDNREIFDFLNERVQLDASKSGIFEQNGSKSTNYILHYNWSLVDTPTKYEKKSHLTFSDPNTNIENTWHREDESVAPASAAFYGYSTTPNNVLPNENYNDEKCKEVEKNEDECKAGCSSSNDELCISNCLHDNLFDRHMYCNKFKENIYLVKLQVKAEDKNTGLFSSTAITYCSPEIQPVSRVEVTLLWEGVGNQNNQENVGNRTGVDVDLDVHLIKKKHSPEWTEDPMGYEFGYMCTMHGTDTEIATDTHDDCYYDDKGLPNTDTNTWNARIMLDNKWGYGPETINLGLFEKDNGAIEDGDYLVVVDYFRCEDFEGKGRCETEKYKNVEATLVIKIDSDLAPRANKDKAIVRKIILRKNEHIPVALINWDNSLEGKPDNAGVNKQGDAKVYDEAANYRICTIESGFCDRVPIFDQKMYYKWVEKPHEFTPQTDENYHYGVERGKCTGGTYKEERSPAYIQPGE